MKTPTYHPGKHVHLHPARGGRAGAFHAALHLPRVSDRQDLELYSSRLDEAVEYESILRDFECARDEALGAERYN